MSRGRPAPWFVALCPSCGQRAAFFFIGRQALGGHAWLALYNCSRCGSTRARRSLKRIGR